MSPAAERMKSRAPWPDEPQLATDEAAPCQYADIALPASDVLPPQRDFLIAADAGLRYLERAALRPDLVVGDWDTLGAPPQHDSLVALPRIKDVTDTFAAMEAGAERGYRHFLLYGCLGGRVEHTIANLQHLAWLAARGMQGALIGDGQAVTLLAGPRTLAFAAGDAPLETGTILDALPIDRRRGSFLSAFSYGEETRGVTMEGLQYTLDDATLTSTFPLGVSNEFLGGPARLSWNSGMLLLVFSLRQDEGPCSGLFA